MGDARVGVDLVDVPSFEARFTGREDVLQTVFTPQELTYCRRQPRPWDHLAARFAAKEALLKALGTGLTGTMQWHEIEIARDPAGAPRVVVTGRVDAALRAQGVMPASVSLAHAGGVAIAVVLLASA